MVSAKDFRVLTEMEAASVISFLASTAASSYSSDTSSHGMATDVDFFSELSEEESFESEEVSVCELSEDVVSADV